MEARTERDSHVEPPRDPAPLPSLPVRLVQAFFSPGKLCEALARRPVWAGAVVLGGLLGAAAFLLVPAEIWEQFIREQMLRSGQSFPEGFEFGNAARIFGTLGGVFFWLVLTFFVSGAVTVVFHFFLGDEGRFAQYLSIVSHALLIAAVGGLLLVPLRIVQQDPQLTLNLSLFVPGDSSSYLMRVLRTLDLFLLWSYVVVALGVSKVDRRRSWGSALAVLLVLALGLSLVFGIFTPAM